MEIAIAEFLLSAAGRALYSAFDAIPGDPTTRLLALRERPGVDAESARAVAALYEARHRAARRFSFAMDWFWTSESVAQATSPFIAAYRARRLAATGYATCADLGCSVGVDSVALAQASLDVIAVERDPARLLFARENAKIAGVADRIQFRNDDFTRLDWAADAAFWDPSRRESVSGNRVSRYADRYEPPLSFLEDVRGHVRGGCVKLSPALPDSELDALGGQIEFLSEDRECKEACVWFGDAAHDDGGVRAVLLPECLEFVRRNDDDLPPLADRDSGGFILDPDPAVIRAGALSEACRVLAASLFSPDDAYLVSEKLPEGFHAKRTAHAYRIREIRRPFAARKMAGDLRATGATRVVVKKRHYPGDSETILREIGWRNRPGGSEVTLILVRDGSGTVAILCDAVV